MVLSNDLIEYVFLNQECVSQMVIHDILVLDKFVKIEENYSD